jgi:hypothetical protein
MMHKKIVFIGLIIPSDAPRIKSRINPLIENSDFQISTISFRNNVSITGLIRFIIDTVRILRSVKKTDCILILDPFALLMISILTIFIGKNSRFFYDRNERWPYNWSVRRNAILKTCSKIPTVFINIEKLCAQHMHGLIGTDYVTLNAIDLPNIPRYLVPNRNYLTEKTTNIFNPRINKLIYFGTFSRQRGNQELIHFLATSRLKLNKNMTLDVWTRASNHTVDQTKISGLNFLPFAPLESIKHAVFNESYSCGLVCVSKCFILERVVPSKIAAYWQLGLPVLAIGESRVLRLMAKFYPCAIRIEKSVDSINWIELRQWIDEASVLYNPRTNNTLKENI